MSREALVQWDLWSPNLVTKHRGKSLPFPLQLEILNHYSFRSSLRKGVRAQWLDCEPTAGSFGYTADDCKGNDLAD